MASAQLLAASLAAALLAAGGGAGARELRLEMPSPETFVDDAMPLIHMLRPLLGSGGRLGRRAGVSCDSWRFAVETNALRDWSTIPARCEGYVGNYMMGGQYRSDSRAVVDEAVAYAEGLQLAGDGREVWVFDVDETTLSNLPYYANHGFGCVRLRSRVHTRAGRRRPLSLCSI